MVEIRKPSIVALHDTPKTPRQPWIGWVGAVLLIAAIAALLGWHFTPHAAATSAGRLAILQANMASAGYDPRLLFRTNTPFGAIATTPYTPTAYWIFAQAWSVFGALAFQALAATAAAIAASALVFLGGALRLTPAQAGAMALATIVASVFIPVLIHGGLPPGWFYQALSLAALSAGLALLVRPSARTRTGVGVLGALAVWAHPAFAIAGLALAVGTVRATSTAHRQAGAIGLALGGALVATQQPLLGAAFWAIAAGGVAAGWTAPRWRSLPPITGGILALVLTLDTFTLPLVPTTAVVAIAVVGGIIAGATILPPRPRRCLAVLRSGPVSVVFLAGGLMGVAGVALMHADVVLFFEAALAGMPWWGLWVRAKGTPALVEGGVCTGLGMVVIAVVLSTGRDGESEAWAWGKTPPHLCPPAVVDTIVADLHSLDATRVLAEPILGWQILLADPELAVVAAGTQDDTHQAGADARTALADPSPSATTARRISVRRSLDAVAICGGTAVGAPDSLYQRLWSGNATRIAPLADWLVPRAEGAAHTIYTIVH